GRRARGTPEGWARQRWVEVAMEAERDDRAEDHGSGNQEQEPTLGHADGQRIALVEPGITQPSTRAGGFPRLTFRLVYLPTVPALVTKILTSEPARKRCRSSWRTLIERVPRFGSLPVLVVRVWWRNGQRLPLQLKVTREPFGATITKRLNLTPLSENVPDIRTIGNGLKRRGPELCATGAGAGATTVQPWEAGVES